MMRKAIPLFFAVLALAALGAPARAQDAAEGAKKAAMCIGCHSIAGYQASFPQVYKVPMIAGQGSAYIGAALAEYKKGDRKHPTMRAIAATLSDKDVADLGAYYEQLPRALLKPVAETPAVQPTAAVAALLAKGACASCHGANYNKPINGAYPKLAGQHADYLYIALSGYAIEGNPRVGRSNAIMVGQVKPFKQAELKAIAGYLASLPGDLRTVPQARFK